MTASTALSTIRPPPASNLPTHALLDTLTAAALLGCSQRTVTNLIQRGHLPATRLGPGRTAYRIDADVLLAFVEQYGHHDPDTVAESPDLSTLPPFARTPALLLVARSPSGLCLVRPLRPPDPDQQDG